MLLWLKTVQVQVLEEKESDYIGDWIVLYHILRSLKKKKNISAEPLHGKKLLLAQTEHEVK